MAFADVTLNFVDLAIAIDAPPPIESSSVEIFANDRFIVYSICHGNKKRFLNCEKK